MDNKVKINYKTFIAALLIFKRCYLRKMIKMDQIKYILL